MATRFKSDDLYLGMQAFDAVLATIGMVASFWLTGTAYVAAVLWVGFCLGSMHERRRERRRLIGIVNRAGLGR